MECSGNNEECPDVKNVRCAGGLKETKWKSWDGVLLM